MNDTDEIEAKLKLIKSHVLSAQTQFRTHGVADTTQMDVIKNVLKRLIGDASYLRDLIKGDR